MPTVSVVLRLLRTYTCDAALSPTSTTASPGGGWPEPVNAATSARTSSVTRSATALPSMMWADIEARHRKKADSSRLESRHDRLRRTVSRACAPCRALAPPSRRYRPFRVDGCVAGWITEARIERLCEFREVFRIGPDAVTFADPARRRRRARTSALARRDRRAGRRGRVDGMARRTLTGVPRHSAALPWFVLERAAARYFGVHTWAAHVNGLVGADGVTHDVARPAQPAQAHRPRDARQSGRRRHCRRRNGGGHRCAESWEEAGIADDLARNARPGGAVDAPARSAGWLALGEHFRARPVAAPRRSCRPTRMAKRLTTAWFRCPKPRGSLRCPTGPTKSPSTPAWSCSTACCDLTRAARRRRCAQRCRRLVALAQIRRRRAPKQRARRGESPSPQACRGSRSRRAASRPGRSHRCSRRETSPPA